MRTITIIGKSQDFIDIEEAKQAAKNNADYIARKELNNEEYIVRGNYHNVFYSHLNKVGTAECSYLVAEGQEEYLDYYKTQNEIKALETEQINRDFITNLIDKHSIEKVTALFKAMNNANIPDQEQLHKAFRKIEL
jgi:hypothetical protein